MIGFGLFVDDVGDALGQVQRAEAAGVDTAWLVMPPLAWDTPTLAAAALARTERIRVGTSIVPLLTRHPLVLATQAVALEGIGPGRFRLGVGTGNLGVIHDAYGAPVSHPVARSREYLAILRSALADGAVDHRGDFYDAIASLAAGPAAAGMELTLAALGPRMFELAGELADAAMSWTCPLPYLDEVARPALERGAGAAGRDRPKLITQVTAVVTDDPVAARESARPMLRRFAANPQYAAMFRAADLPVDDDGDPSDDLVDAVTVCGDEASLTDRLGELADREDELLVTLQPTSGETTARRHEQDALFRAIAKASHA